MSAMRKLHPGLLIGAAAAALGASRAVEEISPAPSEHDEFHHHRFRMTPEWKHRARLKAKRRMRNAMAKASRRRNRR